MLDWVRPMIIDSFAGGGGASTGIEAALGRSPDVAINHSAAALALHAANHPETLHLDSNIWDVSPREVTGGRPVGLLWASPDCKHFSKAKGSAPRDRNIRDLAWVIVRWAEEVRPDVIAMENVEEFVTWGPIDNDGRPVEWLRGATFQDWLGRLRRAGYKVEWRELRACDYGAPTIRKRFFLIARRDGRKIVWPKPTHGAPDNPEVRKGALKPWRTAAEIIDWSLPCPSIFASAAEIMATHGLRAVRPLKPATLARIARGLHRYVLTAADPFLVNLTHGGRLEDLADPIKTITGAHRGEKALIAPSITRFNGGATGSRLDDPAPTVTANSWIKRPGGASPLGMIAPVLTYAQQGGSVRDIAWPTHTITASAKDQNAVIAPMLTHLYSSSEVGGQGDARCPAKTITAGGQHHALAAACLATYYGHDGGRGIRGANLDDPLRTVTVENRHAPISAFLAQQNGGPRMEGHAGRDVGIPISTVTASGSQQMPVAAWMAKWYGAQQDPRLAEPLHTVTTRDRFDVETATLAAPPFAPEHEARARAVAELMRAHGLWDDRPFVTLDLGGTTFVVVDVGMRMLTPRELFRAQGFPDDYVIEGVWKDPEGDAPTFVPFPKDVQISCCGNSVCPPLAEALIRANCGHLAEEPNQVAA
jgi:DNA (cytosine-5)-methyltransferase 1